MEKTIINPLLDNYKKTIIKDVVKNIYKKYCIYDNQSNLIDEKEVIKYLNKVDNKRCCGVSNSSNPKQCKMKAIESYDYCKNHMMTYSMPKIISVDCIKESISEKSDLLNLKKKFIGDSFYYVDTKFIYNNFKEKVGYIQSNEYHFTDDPYILNNIIT